LQDQYGFLASIKLSSDQLAPDIRLLGTAAPTWILTGKSADLIQLAKLVLSECEFDRREIVLKLVEAFRANDDRGYYRLCQEPCERQLDTP
jgi:hypothetical protein